MIRSNDHKSRYIGTVDQDPLTTILCLMIVFVPVCSKTQEDQNLFFLAGNKKNNNNNPYLSNGVNNRVSVRIK